MSWLDGLRHRVSTVLRPGEYDRELDEELSVHHELDALHRGGTQTDVRRRFGNRTIHKEETRAMTWLSWLDLLRQDTNYAWRSVRRTPGTTAMIIVTLALGIGVNAAVFSVLDQLYFRNPSGIQDPAGLRRIWIRHARTSGSNFYSRALAYPQYRVVAEQWGGPGRVAVMTLRSDFKLGGTRAGVSTDVLFTSANYFTLLGVHPARGRFYTDAEAQPGTVTNQVVVSYRYWKANLGGDTAIVGKRIRLDTGEWEVIGVAPEGFDGVDLRYNDVWAPLGSLPGAGGGTGAPGASQQTIWDSPWYVGFWTFARMSDDQNLADFGRRVTAAMREANKQLYGAQADTLTAVTTGGIIESRGPATARQEEVIATRLQGVALIVLIIACANVVNLLLARAVGRKREIAVRLALGIARSRLVRLITIEAVVLALLAAAAALIAAWWGGSLLRSQLMANIKFVQPALHAHVVWATIAVALGCGFLAGVIPALQYSRPQLTADLKDGGRSGGRRRSRLRDGLVVAQAALSVMLLVGSALFVRTLQNVEGIDIGFDTGRVIFANVAYDPGTAPPLPVRVQQIAEIEKRLEGRAGIEVVGRAALTPMGGFSVWTFYWGSDSSGSLTRAPPVGYAVGPKFFAASGIRLLSGRTFDEGAAAEGQVIVNEAFAKMLWPEGDALGQCIRFSKPDAACSSVIGIVSTASRDDVIEQPQPQYYLPIGTKLTSGSGGTFLVVRAKVGAVTAASREVTAMLKEALPTGYPVIRTMAEIVEPRYRPWRLGAKLFTGVGLLALTVALVGIYSTVAYGVGQRQHEFGVRVALGARVGDVLD